MHRERLRLRVKVLDECIYNRVIEHVAISFHHNAGHSVISQHAEQLVKAFWSDDVVGKIHIRPSRPDVWERLDDGRHARAEPITKPQECCIHHGWVSMLELDV